MVIKDPRCVAPWFDEYDLLPGGNIESNPVLWARLFFFFVKDIFKKKTSGLSKGKNDISFSSRKRIGTNINLQLLIG